MLLAAGRILLSVGLIGAMTFVGYALVPVNALSIGFFYLVAVVLEASFWGLRESIAASLAACICLNYFFLPPVLHFTIADPQNWVALFAFLVTAVLVSELSARARQQTQRAMDRQAELERLYALSRSILLTETNDAVAQKAAGQIAATMGLTAVSLYERSTGNIYRAGSEDLPEWDNRLREVALQGVLLQEPETRTIATAVRLGAVPIGSLVLRGAALSDSALQSVANLVAIALERAQTVEAANRANVARQSEELKSTLLDAIAHEFQTPLTSIKIAATALLPMSRDAAQKELATIVDEEAGRLGRLVTEAIQMSRIEAGRIHLQRRMESVGGLVSKVAGEFHTDRLVRIDVPEDLPHAGVDAELIELTLRQLIDNAIKYSPAGSPITIRARLVESRIVLGIRNEGPGIPEADQSRIFERFYRVPESSFRVPGTGMGLAIARDIVQAHDGRIWVESTPGQGAEFCVSLPLHSEEVYA